MLNMYFLFQTEVIDEVRGHKQQLWIYQWAVTVLLIERWLPNCFHHRVGTTGNDLGFKGSDREKYFVLRAFNSLTRLTANDSQV